MARRQLGLSDFDFSGINVQGPSTGGIGNRAAAAVQSVRSSSPNYGGLAELGIRNRAQEKSAAMMAEADVYGTRVMADAQVEAAQAVADAQKSAAQKQAQGSMMGSVFGAIGSIGGALLSDETTKNNIEAIDNALAMLRELKPVTFQYNEEYSSDPHRLHHGFIAQDYIKVMPDATYFDDNRGKLCIDTVELIALLVRSVQQLEAKVTRLEAANALVGV